MNSVSAINNSLTAAYTVYDPTSNKQLISSIRKPDSSTKKKKKLNYSFKQISTRVMQARTAPDAYLAYVSTLYKVVELRKKCMHDDYDASEAMIALSHAEAILLVARKKKDHLKEEERAEEQCDDTEYSTTDAASDSAETPSLSEDDISALAEEMAEFSREEFEDMLKDIEEEMNFEAEMNDLCEMISPDMSEDDIEELKKKHRAREMMEITKADMKYLKAMFERYEREKGGSGISKLGSATDMTDMAYSALASEQVSAECFSGFSVDINV